jgi:hypothetical protein
VTISSGEFRHQTATLTYLAALPGRGAGVRGRADDGAPGHRLTRPCTLEGWHA